MLATRVCLCLLLATPLAASQFVLQKFTADVPAWGEELGADVSIDGDALALARHGADLDGIPDRGSIQVYRWTAGTWMLEQEVVAPDAEPWDQLGSCALEGDLLVAGAPLDDVDGQADAGSVRVFERGDGGWVQTQLLAAPTVVAGEQFGTHVALDDSLLVVGTPDADVPLQTDRGRVDIFRRSAGSFTWETALALNAPSGHSGSSVAVDDGVVVFGAPGAGVAGTAAVARKPGSTWKIPQLLDGQDFGELGPSLYGYSIALHDGLLAVGEPGGLTHGLVATYRDDGTTFVLTAWLSPTDPVNDAAFGVDVALSGGWIAIGAPGANGPPVGLGAVYLHQWNPATSQWGPELKLVGGPADWGSLGQAVAIDGPLVVAGTPSEKVVATASEGSATLFSFMNPAWSYAGGGLPGSHGVPSLTGGGTLQAATTVTLSLRDGRESATTALFIGSSAIEAPFKGGTLVPLPTLAIVLATNGAGELTLSATWPGSIPSGATLWLQAWIVDPAGVSGWAATNGLKATAP